MALDWSRRGLVSALFATATTLPYAAHAKPKAKKTAKKTAAKTGRNQRRDRRGRLIQTQRQRRAPALPVLIPTLMVAETAETANPFIAEGNSRASKPPMSLTKLMLVHLALKKLESGELDPNQIVEFGPATARVAPDHCGFRPGQRIPLIDMMALALRNSCNQSAEELGRVLFGTKDAAVLALNEEADEMGLDDTDFVTPSGLNDGRDYGETTAFDMTKMAMQIDRRWDGNYFYNQLIDRNGYFLREETWTLFRARGYRPEASEIIDDGARLKLNATATSIMPSFCTPLKTGTWGQGADRHKNLLFKFTLFDKTLIGCVLDCRPPSLGTEVANLVRMAQDRFPLRDMFQNIMRPRLRG